MAPMTLRTYRAGSMAQALAEVRKDLGPDAVILHTRTYKVGRIFGMGGRQVVEVTASSSTDTPHQRRPGSRTTVGESVGRSLQGRPGAPVNPSGHASGHAGGHTSGHGSASSGSQSSRQRTVQKGAQASHQGMGRPGSGAPSGATHSANPGAMLGDDLSARLDGALAGLGAPARAGRSSQRLVPRSRVELTDRVRRGFDEDAAQAPHEELEAGVTTLAPEQTRQFDDLAVEVKRQATRQSQRHGHGQSQGGGAGPIALAPGESRNGGGDRAGGIGSLTTRVPLAPVNADARAALESELASIKKMMGQVLQTTRRNATGAGVNHGAAAVGGMPDALFDVYRALIEQDVDGAIADDLIGQVRDELNSGELQDPAIVRQSALRRIAGAIPVSGPPAIRRDADDGPLVLALVGPTGVGKTTTLAKLAAAYKLRHAKRVALITCDTYRIAAVEQLRTYANIIGVPLRVVNDAQEMRALRESFADHEVVLIDTPGRSQHDGDRLAELQALIEAAEPTQTHLVLSLAAAEGVLTRAAERFMPVGPDRLVLTKLDEAVSFGVILNTGRRTELPLSFVTTGQEVPDHIEPASAERLARLILDGQPAPATSAR